MQSDSAYKLVRLANGAHSVHSVSYGETFHPVVGPVAEAEALYVRQLALPERVQQHAGEFVIWDVGLGAAGNSLNVLRATRRFPAQMRIVSFDQTLEPLRFALAHARELEYLHGYDEPLRELASGQKACCLFTDARQHVAWEVHVGDFPTLIQQPAAEALPKPHAILFDAYSPASNPGMWTQPLFARIFQLLDPSRACVMPTYSRSTLLRVTLLLAGFYVGKGHATGEKEETTIAANSREFIREPLDRAWLKRVRKSSSAEPLWIPVYRQAKLAEGTWERLIQHPQFA